MIFMNILFLTFKKHEGLDLARALGHYGHRVVVHGITLAKDCPIIKIGRIVKLILKEHGKHDVVIAENMLYDGLAGLILSKLDNIPLVLYIKGFFPTDYLDSPYHKILRGPGSYLTEQVITKSDCIIYVSQWLKDKYDEYFRKRRSSATRNKLWRIIHHAPRAFFLKNEKKETKKGDNNIVLCYAGNLNFRGKARGILLLFNAFKKLLNLSRSNIILYVVGDGKYRPLLERKIKQLKLDSRVLFTGKVSQTSLKTYFQTSDIFVYPSYNDACPTVVMEAQACGIPAIVTNSSGAAEIVEDEVTGLICRSTAGDLANSLLKLMENPSKGEMGANAQKHMRYNLCWDVSAKLFNEVLDVLIAQRNSYDDVCK